MWRTDAVSVLTTSVIPLTLLTVISEMATSDDDIARWWLGIWSEGGREREKKEEVRGESSDALTVKEGTR